MVQRAETEKQAIESNAAEQVAKILGLADAEIGRLRETALANLDRELERFESQLQSEAAVVIRSQKLEVKRKAIDEVFADAADRLKKEGTKADRLTVLVQEAVAAADDGSGDIVLRVPKNAAEPLGRQKMPNLTIHPDASLSEGTIIAEGKGLRVVDNSISTRLYRARKQLLPELGAILFEA